MRRSRFAGEDPRREVKPGLLWVAVLLSVVAGSYGEQPTLVIENARVIVGDGAVKDDATVVITAGRIASVSAESPQLEAAKMIDARGMTLMPGLIDTHIHFFGLLDDLGTVEPGKTADLILVAGDPLKDISSLHKVRMVIQESQIVYHADEQTAMPKGVPSDSNPVGWFEIPVTDMARARTFYEQVLNVKPQPAKIGPLEMAMFPMRPGTPGATGALMKGEAFQPSRQGVQIYFTTPDVDGTLERVQKLAGRIVLPKTRIGPLGFIASFEDSEGNQIGLRSW